MEELKKELLDKLVEYGRPVAPESIEGLYWATSDIFAAFEMLLREGKVGKFARLKPNSYGEFTQVFWTTRKIADEITKGWEYELPGSAQEAE